jgi:hypothetical protein
MPIVHLRQWLETVEPAVFSAANLKAVVKRGQRDQSRQVITEIIEFTTGLDPSTNLFGRSMDEAGMNKFVSELVQTYKDMGRRGRDIMLPPDWARDGVYSLRQSLRGNANRTNICPTWPRGGAKMFWGSFSRDASRRFERAGFAPRVSFGHVSLPGLGHMVAACG